MATSPDSALKILKQMKNYNSMSDEDKALYGLLYFQALDDGFNSLPPDSFLDKSIIYYQKQDKKILLAKCYYYKARLNKIAQRFENATVLYLKALDMIK